MTYALIVDAGYLLHMAARLINGVPFRDGIAYDPSAAVRVLSELLRGREEDGLLTHVFWFDGARDGVLSPEQNELSVMPGVTLVAPPMHGPKQDDVDRMICERLTRMASAGAVDRIYLLTGDSDLLEGVCAWVDNRKEVILVGVDVRGDRSQSAELVHCATDRVVISERQVRSFAARATGATGHSRMRVA